MTNEEKTFGKNNQDNLCPFTEKDWKVKMLWKQYLN